MNIFILFLSMLLFTVQAHALPIGPIIPSGTTLPATCRVGELFIDTDADTNGSLYNCVATDTWKEVDDDGGDGGDIAKVGTPAQYEWGIWTGDGTLKGLSVTASNVVCTDSDGEPVACTNLTDLDFMTSAEFTTAIGSDNDTQSKINAKFDAKMDVTWGTPTAKVCGDANPEGIANGGFYDFSNVGAFTITDFEDADGDHTDYNEGDSFLGKFADADIKVDFSENANIEGNAGVDFTASATQIVYILFVYESARWNAVNFTSGYSTPTTLGISSIETPTLQEDEWNDEADDRLLTVAELKNKIITNAGLSADTHFDMPVVTEGWNVIFVIEAAYQVDVHPNDSAVYYLNGTVLGADEMISNSADTVAESMVCFSTEAGKVYCESNYSNFAAIAEPS